MNEDWEKLRDYLIAVCKKVKERNGLDYCKNCGVDFKFLVSELDKIIHDVEEV